MKRKSPGRLKSELWKTLWPEIDHQALANEIGEFLDEHVGKSARIANVANNLAAYLAQKYWVANRKAGKLRWLIERHADDVAAFLHEISFKELQALIRTSPGPSKPINLQELAESLLKKPDELPSSQDEPPRRKKKPRPRPKTETERARRRGAL